MLRKTKIVCTIGPASWSEENLTAMIKAGMNVARLNFSHGTHQSHKEIIDRIRRISKELSLPVAILQDLCGPKIRLGEVANAPVELKKDGLFTLYEDERVGNSQGASVSYDGLYKEIQPGDRVLVDDGLIEMVVESIAEKEVVCRIHNDGVISSHKGVNFPGVNLTVPSLTEKDLKDLEFGIENEVDFIAISFVRRAEDLQSAYDLMSSHKVMIPIISKIEKAEALENIESILEKSYGIMVARGDLGVEIPFEKVPVEQKRLISLARKFAKPVITATQMMDSMIRNPYPTRAEVNDVANAIFDGTDAVMLSGETASGAYPLRAVEAMASIALSTEPTLPYNSIMSLVPPCRSAVETISLAACEMAYAMDAAALMIFTSSGRSAISVSNFRPQQIVIGVTPFPRTQRRLLLSWAVYPILVDHIKNFSKHLELAVAKALDDKYIIPGDAVVITAGLPNEITTSTNTIMFHIAESSIIRGEGAGKRKVVSGKACIIDYDSAKGNECREGDIIVANDYETALRFMTANPAALVIEKTLINDLTQLDYPVVHGAVSAAALIENGSVITVDSKRGIIMYNPQENKNGSF